MQIKNGVDAMIEILKINKNEKIIFTSADITVRHIAISFGACAFLDKQFKMHELLNKIQQIVKELVVEQ